jgi:hypothetical protein
MSNDLWRWADPSGQQRKVRLEELRAALAEGHIAPNTPVWRSGWQSWKPAHDVPELSSASVGGANGVVLNIPPPPLAMLAIQQEYEQKASAIAPGLTPRAEKEPEPPPPPPYVPMPAKAGSMNPPPEKRKTQIGGSAHMPIAPSPAAAAPSSPPVPASPGSAPSLGSSLPTTIGVPPPLEVVALASASPALGAGNVSPPPAPRSDQIEELSTSALLDASSSSVGMAGQPSLSDPALDDAGLGGIEPQEEDVRGIARKPGLDVLLQDLARMRGGKPPRNKLVLGVLGGVALLIVVLFVAGIASLVSGSSSDSKKTAASASASQSAAQGSASTLATPTRAPTTTAKASGPVLGNCTTAGEAKTIAPRAQIVSGIEAHALGGGLVLGFAPSARDAVAMSLDPTTLSPTATARAKPVGGQVRRVTPMLVNGKLAAVADTDRKNDRLAGRRVAGPAGVVDVGVSDGSIAWAPHGRDSIAELFSLEGDGPVEALRAISLPDGKGIAVTFRRGNSINVGIAKGDGVLERQGEMSTIVGQGQVGSPALAASGEHVIVAWADRAGSDDDWGIRWTKIKIGTSTQEAMPFTIPEGGLGGQAMSPAIASLGGGRFLLAWTEGPVSNHQVRALTFDADGSPSGSPLSISTSGVNAGQPAAVVGPDGRGLVAYLAAKGKSVEVEATPVICPPLGSSDRSSE